METSATHNLKEVLKVWELNAHDVIDFAPFKLNYVAWSFLTNKLSSYTYMKCHSFDVLPRMTKRWTFDDSSLLKEMMS